MNARLLASFTGVITAAVVAFPAGASAGDGDNRCRKAADRYTVVKKTKSGAIFYKRVGSRRFQLFYGCLHSTGRLRVLPGQDRDTDPARSVRAFTLNGRYAAYSTVSSEETRRGFRYEAERLFLYDLKRGRTVWAGRANVPDADERSHNDVIVTDIVGTARGSLAWISYDVEYDEPIGQVHVRDLDGPRRVIDESTKIGRFSLTKARDGRAIAWVKDGQRRTAPLP
jgi:hypothetical protein